MTHTFTCPVFIYTYYSTMYFYSLFSDQNIASYSSSETTPSLHLSLSPRNAEYSGCNSTNEEESQDITDTKDKGEQSRDWDAADEAEKTQGSGDKDRLAKFECNISLS